MTTIKGQSFLTIHAAAGEVYDIDYAVPSNVSISNNTDGNIIIGCDPDFADNTDGTAGRYAELAAGTAANNITLSFDKLYIKAESDGDIVIVRC